MFTEDSKWEVTKRTDWELTKDKIWIPEQKNRLGFSGKTGWDWFQLLIQVIGAIAVPLTIIAGFLQFNAQQMADQRKTEQQRIVDFMNLQEQQRQTTLQTYLDRMSDLLLNHKLHESKRSDDVQVIATVQTLTALQQLDPGRKTIVVQFLYEADLIGVNNPTITINKADNPIIKLSGADLSKIVITGFYMDGADIHNTHLNKADLSYDVLSNDNISISILNNASLSHVNLHNTDLHKSDLMGVDLTGAILTGTNLSGAILTGADLSGATLRGAKVTNKQLAQAKSLKGATMPDGSIHP